MSFPKELGVCIAIGLTISTYETVATPVGQLLREMIFNDKISLRSKLLNAMIVEALGIPVNTALLSMALMAFGNTFCHDHCDLLVKLAPFFAMASLVAAPASGKYLLRKIDTNMAEDSFSPGFIAIDALTGVMAITFGVLMIYQFSVMGYAYLKHHCESKSADVSDLRASLISPVSGSNQGSSSVQNSYSIGRCSPLDTGDKDPLLQPV